MKNINDNIKKAFALGTKIVIIFKDNNIKILEPNLLNGDIHSKNIAKKIYGQI